MAEGAILFVYTLKNKTKAGNLNKRFSLLVQQYPKCPAALIHHQ